jgi:hypothetical protein
MEEAGRRHRDEIQALKESFSSERLVAEQQQRDLVEARAKERLGELRATLEKEQERALDVVVVRGSVLLGRAERD